MCLPATEDLLSWLMTLKFPPIGTDFVNVNNEPVAPLEDGDVVMRAGEVMTCGGVFLDSGGDRDYENNQNITMTLVPLFADSKVSVEFTSFRTESRDDLPKHLRWCYCYCYSAHWRMILGVGFLQL